MSPSKSVARRVYLATPEHVELRFELAGLGERLAAYLLDLTAVTVISMVFWMLLATTIRSSQAVAGLLLVAIFLLRTFYFAGSEIHWRGRTPGKRQMKLRVVSSDGGPLTASQVFARNLTREVEVALPLTLILVPSSLIRAPWWARLMVALWALSLLLLPLFNQRRARLGDLAAGTMVVSEPRARLLEDLVETRLARDARQSGAYDFTQAQLDIYGIEELQVLERVLRQVPNDANQQLQQEICSRVVRKIEWPGILSRGEERAFLFAFYKAQRQRLEHKLLLGQRQKRKRF